jgi:serine/threonine-protein kinase
MPKPVAEILPGLPPALDRITAKALAKDAANRYSNALDMANEISAVRAELSGAPHPRTLSLAQTGGSIPDDRVPAPALTQGGSTEVITPPRKFPLWAIGAGVAALALIGWMMFGRKSEPTTAVQTPSENSVVAQTDTGAKADTASNSVASAAQPVAPPAPAEKISQPSATAAKAKPVEKAVTVAPRKVVQETPRPRTVASQPVATKPAPTPSIVVAAPQVVAPPVSSAPAAREGVPKPPPVVNTMPVGPPAEKPRNPSAEIASAVGAYARAIESRDIGAVRRAYPGLTSEQARGFEQFFDSAKNINVTFRVVGLEVNGNSADARLVGTYQYTNGSRTETQPVSFAASLRNDGTSWKLTSVR